MKRRKRRGKGAEFVDADFAEMLNGEGNGDRSDSRQVQRKTQQFCRQVQRALNLALADSSVAGIGCDLFVDEVSPGSDCGHLLVHIVVQDGYSVVDAISALRSDASRLRSEVAMAIGRKRAPELSFVPVSVQGKRLTNTPVRQAGSVLKCPDDRKNRVVSAQATYTSGGSAVGG